MAKEIESKKKCSKMGSWWTVTQQVELVSTMCKSLEGRGIRAWLNMGDCLKAVHVVKPLSCLHGAGDCLSTRNRMTRDSFCWRENQETRVIQVVLCWCWRTSPSSFYPLGFWTRQPAPLHSTGRLETSRGTWLTRKELKMPTTGTLWQMGRQTFAPRKPTCPRTQCFYYNHTVNS